MTNVTIDDDQYRYLIALHILGNGCLVGQRMSHVHDNDEIILHLTKFNSEEKKIS